MKEFDNITWDEYFMYIAEVSALRSKDPKTKVGACIADSNTHKILSIGYNGFPTNFPENKDIWYSEEKHKYVVHAEANAILNANVDLHDATLYVTMFPCNECAKLLAQVGIKKVVYLDDKFLSKDTGKTAEEIFQALDIKIEHYNGLPLKDKLNNKEKNNE